MTASHKPQLLNDVLEHAVKETRTFINCDMKDAVVRPSEITVTPIVNRESISTRRTVRIGKEVQQKLFGWLSYPHLKLAGRVSEETQGRVIDEQLAYELGLPAARRKLPARVRLILMEEQVVGILPAKLFAPSNEEFVNCFQQAAAKHRIKLDDAEVRSSHIDHGSLKINATFPSLVSEPKVGDIVQFGLSLRHSSVGLHSSQIGFYAYRLFCLNGHTAPVCLSNNGTRKRIRRSHEESAEKTLAGIREMVSLAFKNIPSRIDALTKLSEQRVNVRNAVEELVTRNRWSRHVKQELSDAIERNEHDGDETAFGVVNLLSFLGTHGPQARNRTIPQSVLNRLQLIAGVYAGQGVHQCPSCRRILSPSNN